MEDNHELLHHHNWLRSLFPWFANCDSLSLPFCCFVNETCCTLSLSLPFHPIQRLERSRTLHAVTINVIFDHFLNHHWPPDHSPHNFPWQQVSWHLSSSLPSGKGPFSTIWTNRCSFLIRVLCSHLSHSISPSIHWERRNQVSLEPVFPSFPSPSDVCIVCLILKSQAIFYHLT